MTVLSNFQLDVPSLSADLALDSEVDSVDWKHNDLVLCCLFQMSRESVWFSVPTTAV